VPGMTPTKNDTPVGECPIVHTPAYARGVEHSLVSDGMDKVNYESDLRAIDEPEFDALKIWQDVEASDGRPVSPASFPTVYDAFQSIERRFQSVAHIGP
jgi:hypothetical protein